MNAEQDHPKKRFSVFWKFGEKFNLEELINPLLVDCNLTENFTVDVVMGIFQNAEHNIHSCFSVRICPSITIKSNQFAGKKYKPSDFLKKQRE